jgi:hypothetical protein
MSKKQKRMYIVIGGFFLGLLFTTFSNLSICDEFTSICGDILGEMIGVTLGMFSLATFLPMIFLSFMRDEVFTAWWKFARIYIPIALVLIAISDGGGMLGGLGAGGGYDREGMIWFTSGLFFIISMILIPLKFRKYRPVKEKQFLGISRVHKDSSRD